MQTVTESKMMAAAAAVLKAFGEIKFRKLRSKRNERMLWWCALVLSHQLKRKAPVGTRTNISAGDSWCALDVIDLLEE